MTLARKLTSLLRKMAPGRSRARLSLSKDSSKRHNFKHSESKNFVKVVESRNEIQVPSKASNAPHMDNSSPCPRSMTALKLFLSSSLCSVVWTGISDCDETFNYWEPTHLLIYGTGFQTWEYSPVYALRSYLYLWPQAVIGKLCFEVFHLNKVSTFYVIRSFLGIISALCQLYFYQGICKKFGSHVGRLALVFLIFSTGLFVSSTAYLPSSFAMYTTMLSFAAWFNNQNQFAILSVALGAIVGWPFAALTGIPLALSIIFIQKKAKYFAIWSLISLVLFMIPLVAIDSYYYGKLVVAPFNIILYNVFSQHGPDIYGVESWTFYFLNGFLNFNFAFISALFSAPLLLVYYLGTRSTTYVQSCAVTLTAMYLWVAVFFTRPHKEERFLFPIYPLICLASALTLDCSKKIIMRLWKRKYTSKVIDYFTITFLVICSLLSISRSVVIYKGFKAPVEVFLEASSHFENENGSSALNSDSNICVGKEWHRFPSSFFLPTGLQLKFLQSEFKGQLPQPFSKNDHPTSVIPKHMNDMNLEETTRYVTVDQCQYLIDADFPYESNLEPRYSNEKNRWQKLVSVPFLYSQKSSKLFRSFYIPYFTETKCSFVDYNILKVV